MAIYRPHALDVFADSMGVGPALILPGITQQDWAVNNVLLSELTAAATRPRHTAIAQISPLATGTTFSLDSALNVMGTTGLCIQSSTNPGWKMFDAQLDFCGNVMAGAVHREYLVRDGLWAPTTLTCTNRENAVLNWECYTLSDEQNIPVIVSDVATLPAVALPLEKWTLGPIQIDGIPLIDYTSVTIDFGLTIDPLGTQSDVYDKYIGVKNSIPVVTIEGVDPTYWQNALGGGAVPLNGLGVSAATTDLFLRQRSEDGTHFTPNATLAHIQFSMNGIAVVEGKQSSTTAATSASIRIQCAEDDQGNAPLIMALGGAIPP